jgi:hypothetical protein
VGILLSWIYRRYWLGLAGLGGMVVATAFFGFGHPQVGRPLLWLGMALMLVQVLLRVRSAWRDARQHRADRERNR